MSKPAEAGAPVLVTMGEPSGIGPEVAAKAWHALGGRVGARALRLVGDPWVFRRQREFADDAFWPADGARRGETEGAAGAIAAIDAAVGAALEGRAGAVVTAPIHKARLIEAGFAFAGHTEYLAKLTGAPRAVMMLVGGDLRVVPLTIHIPLADVPAAISQTAIVETGEIVLASLARDFAIARPRLAIAGLNPHAGESGRLGREDLEIVAPAAELLRARGHFVSGPHSADTLFHERARVAYDAALCMYHDQALIPLKTLAFFEGVNVTLGLPIVRTSPDHGTACDIAGQGKADPRSMIAAIRLAAAMADARGLDPLPPLREVIAAHGLGARKSLGQNFLLDLNLARKIARAAGPLDGATIYEVGAGPGGLTRALLAEGAARVVAVERDRRCLPALEDIAQAYPGRLDIVAADAMALNEEKIFRERSIAAPVRIAANLPYNIATALLVKWLTGEAWPPFWRSLTLMFQREVARRLVAVPGSSDYGRLSILSQWRAQPRLLFDVDPRAFTPSPEVISTLVRIEPLARPRAPARLEEIERVSAQAFGQRRKMLRQSLKRLAPDAEERIRAAGIDPKSRPQDLGIEEFAALARAFANA